MSPEDKQRFKTYCEARQISMTDMINKLIYQEIGPPPEPATPQSEVLGLNLQQPRERRKQRKQPQEEVLDLAS